MGVDGASRLDSKPGTFEHNTQWTVDMFDHSAQVSNKAI